MWHNLCISRNGDERKTFSETILTRPDDAEIVFIVDVDLLIIDSTKRKKKTIYLPLCTESIIVVVSISTDFCKKTGCRLNYQLQKNLLAYALTIKLIFVIT